MKKPNKDTTDFKALMYEAGLDNKQLGELIGLTEKSVTCMLAGGKTTPRWAKSVLVFRDRLKPNLVVRTLEASSSPVEHSELTKEQRGAINKWNNDIGGKEL